MTAKDEEDAVELDPVINNLSSPTLDINLFLSSFVLQEFVTSVIKDIDVKEKHKVHSFHSLNSLQPLSGNLQRFPFKKWLNKKGGDFSYLKINF